jgi:hypothetical protein
MHISVAKLVCEKPTEDSYALTHVSVSLSINKAAFHSVDYGNNSVRGEHTEDRPASKDMSIDVSKVETQVDDYLCGGIVLSFT